VRMSFSEQGHGRRPFYPDGIWGATTTEERKEIKHLPVEEAMDQLEAVLPARLRLRIEAFAARYPRDGRQNVRANRLWRKLDAMVEQIEDDKAAASAATPSTIDAGGSGESLECDIGVRNVVGACVVPPTVVPGLVPRP
jgi:hypothetical protein